MKYWLAVPLLLLMSVARADIVFVDLNNNPLEIETARAAAKARKEELVIYPPTGERAKEAARLQERVNQLSKRVFSGVLSEADRKKYEGELNTAREAAQKHSEGLSAASLAGLLKKIKGQGRSVSALILSGHDGNGSFFGANGKIASGDLNEALKEDSAGADKIRSLYLWGCYTANFGACQGHWKNSLPNLGIIVGFDGSAPAGDKPANHAYLRDALQKEPKFLVAKDVKTVDRLFKSLNGVNQMHASICVGDVVANGKGTFNSKQMTEQCRKLFADRKPKVWSDRIACYRDASKGCEDVPADTRQGELRKIYEEMQGAKHCQIMAKESEDPEIRKLSACWPDATELLRLVLYKQVAKNFASLHGEDVKAYDQTLADFKLPDAMKLGDVSRLTRAQLHEKLTNASMEAQRQTSKAENFSNLGAVKASEVLERNRTISQTLSRLNTYCVSDHWVEPGARDKSNCMPSIPAGGSTGTALENLSKQVDKEIGVEMTKRNNELRLGAEATAREFTTSLMGEEAQKKYMKAMEDLQAAVEKDRAVYTEKKIAYMKRILEAGKSESAEFAQSEFYKSWDEEKFRKREMANAVRDMLMSAEPPLQTLTNE